MADFTVKVEGLKELAAKLKTLPAAIQKKVLRKGLSAAAQVIKKAAIANAPVAAAPIKRGGGIVTRPGTLKSAAIVKFLRSESNEQQAVYIVTFRRGKKAQRIGKKATNKDAFYASWVEFGHRVVPRSTRLGRDKRGRSINRFTLVARRKASTQQVAGRRFLTNAFKNDGQKALTVLETTTRAEFEKAIS